MTPKDILTNPAFCPMPWTGLMYNYDGQVKNCIRSSRAIGNIKNDSIQNILLGEENISRQHNILNQTAVDSCQVCYKLEHKKSFDIISDRIFYIKELRQLPMNTYTEGQHDLHTVDVRWSNLCNFACVYCSPEFSSKWASELDQHTPQPNDEQKTAFKNYILENAHQLKHVYLAGGEPLLMKENLELLELLHPDTTIRVNTNLSQTDTRVFERICEFKNVHWTVSAETMGKEYEYIRYGGTWSVFLDNLSKIQSQGHKVTFNMLYFLLNYSSMFDFVDYFTNLGYHPNSFVIGALLDPVYLNIRHLPQDCLQYVKHELENRIEQQPGFLLENSYRNLLRYIQLPFKADLTDSFQQLALLDARRGLDSSTIFKNLYTLKETHYGN
jgi:uncharacterized Fe-S cluster-containing radical SAM superfamily protein